MAVKLTNFWEGYIFGLSDAQYSYSMIVKKCEENGLRVSKATVGKVIHRCKDQPPGTRGRPEKWSRSRAQPARQRGVLKEINKLMRKENPPTQRSAAARKNISQRTVGRIIRENLNLVKRHKARGHKLLPKHIKERFTNARKLYEGYLSGDKWEQVASLDEAWVYIDDTNKPRAIYYKEKGSKGRSDFVRECKEKFSKGFMVVAGYCARGQLTISRVQAKAKVNAAYFQKNVMERIYREDIPRLYGNDVSNVWIHMDKASAHTAKSSLAWYAQMEAETKIRVIPFSSIPVKSPDASPMDFCGFGLLKRGIASRRPATIEGLWKACKEVWYGIPVEQLRRSLLQWKLRCRAIVHNRGHHIEHNRWWRKGIK